MNDSVPVENWLPIDGWPGYEVSDYGHVCSYWGQGGGKQGQRAIGPFSKLIGYTKDSGHREVLLYRNQGADKKRVRIHTLVLEAFVGPRPSGMWACHDDGNPTNNWVGNLRWDTPKSNNHDTLRHGNHVQATLTEADIPEIWKRLVAGDSDTAIGKDWKVRGVTIGAIRSGNSWSHIAKSLPGWPILTEAQLAVGDPVYIAGEFHGPEELWRPLPDWPPYRVSNRGGIQSCLEKAKGKGVGRGVMLLTDNWKDRATVLDSDGYCVFWARRNGEKPTMLKVHACVLRAFAGEAPAGFIACHNNANRSDNSASNLRWDTQRANAGDRESHKPRRSKVNDG